MKKEIWKDIPNYEGLYQVSNYGRVKSIYNESYIKGKNQYSNFICKKINKEKILKPKLTKDGYYEISLTKNKILKSHRINRLVAKAFIHNPNDYPIVNHKSGIKTDNRVCNLEWCTHKYNVKHALKNNLRKHYKIAQYSKDGKLIKIYTSRYEIKDIDQSNITRCCNGIRKSAGGYRWKYVD